MPEIVEINKLEDLDRYHLLWKSLVGDTPNATFFHSLDWLRAHLAHDQQSEPKVLVVFSGGKPVGIVPFIQRHSNCFMGIVKTLELPVHDWCACIGPIGPNPTATLTAGLRYLRDNPRDWDTMELAMSEPPFNFERLTTAMEVTGFASQTTAKSSSGMVYTRHPWDSYLQRRPAGFVERLRRLQDRLPELGRTSFLRIRPGSHASGDGTEHWDIFHDCLKLARQHWQGRTRSSALMVNQASVEFLTRLHEVATRSGALDLNVLLIEDEPAAFFYNVHYQGRCQLVWWGSNPIHHKYAVDRILLSQMIQDSIQRQDEWIDMGQDGIGRWRPWMTKMAVTREMKHYPRTVAKAQALRVSRWMHDRLSRKGNTARLG